MVTNDRDWDLRVHGGLLAGDENALADAYDCYAPLVYGIALRATGDEATAEDLTEQVFLRMWEHPAEFDPDRGSLRVLLCELARRRAVEFARESGLPFKDAAAELWWGRGPWGPWASPDTRTVRKALLDLPEHQRNAILLAYFHGLGYRQVAQELGIPEETARDVLHHGLDRLGKALAL
jgi:RNA polymerase sigma-70 factor, ECF subfamily